MKINLTQKILNIKGEEISKDEVNPKTKKMEKKVLTVRDYFLVILGTKFPIKDNKETFWTSDLGILFAGSENKEVEVSDEKLEFLKRIIGDNKITVPQPMGGEKETTIFFPYELGQLLKILDGKGEKLAKEKEAKEETKEGK